MKVLFLLPDGRVHTILALPTDRYLARQLFVFLVENMQPGWGMVLIEGHKAVSVYSGEKLSQELYEEIMAFAEPNH